MYTEARKIHLLEEVIKTTNEETLIKLEAVLSDAQKSKEKKAKNKILTIYDFAGTITDKEANEMKKAAAYPYAAASSMSNGLLSSLKELRSK